ncbi:DUF2594 family protein, partial [Escherichia sp. HC-CC]
MSTPDFSTAENNQELANEVACRISVSIAFRQETS